MTKKGMTVYVNRNFNQYIINFDKKGKQMTDYEKYQLHWMIVHGHSLNELMQEMERLQTEICEPVSISELFRQWESDSGFGSEIWACEEEWMDEEGIIPLF